MARLGNHASFHTDFTFDNQMLRELARGVPGDEETQHIVANLQSVTVHVYRYRRAGLYNPADLEPVRNHYHGTAWKHLVATGPTGEILPTVTDLWIRYEHGNVEAMVLLVAKPKMLDLVEVNGKISPLDLLHLRGHFGIPNFPADRFADARQNYLADGR